MSGKLDYLIPIGILKKTKKFVAGHISLTKLMGEVFNWMKVPFSNPCCDGKSDSAPVRYNTATPGFEYYDETTDAWVAVI
jgi:hypothetical protein